MSFQYKSIINWYSSTLELPEFSTLDSLIDDFKIQGLYRLMRIFMKEVGKDFEANIEILRKRGMVNEDRRHLTENEFLLKLLSNIHTQYKTTQRHNKSFSFGNTNPKIYNWQKLSRNSSSNVSKQNLKPRGSFSAHLPSSSPYKITRSLGTSMNKIYLAQESQYLMDVTQTSSFSNDLKSRKLLQMERLSQNEERKLMWIADKRVRAEQIPSESLTLKFRKKNGSVDNLLLFLLKPRVLILTFGIVNKQPFLVNLIPNEIKFSYSKEEYLFEWKEIISLNLVGVIDISAVVGVFKTDNDVSVTLNSDDSTGTFILHCSNLEEANKYEQGLLKISVCS